MYLQWSLIFMLVVGRDELLRASSAFKVSRTHLCMLLGSMAVVVAIVDVAVVGTFC